MKTNYNTKPKKILFFRKEQLIPPPNNRAKLLTFGNFTRVFFMSLSLCALVLFSTLQAQAQTWTHPGADINGEATGGQSGESVSLSTDGNIVAIGVQPEPDLTIPEWDMSSSVSGIANANWMTRTNAYIGDFPLAYLLIGGSHHAFLDDAGTFFIGSMFAQAQSRTITAQLKLGVRYLDCRWKYDGYKLIPEHGAFFQKKETALPNNTYIEDEHKLPKVKEWINTPGNEKELLIIHLKELKKGDGVTDAKLRTHVENLFSSTFGAKMITRSELEALQGSSVRPGALTINQLLTKGNILVIQREINNTEQMIYHSYDSDNCEDVICFGDGSRDYAAAKYKEAKLYLKSKKNKMSAGTIITLGASVSWGMLSRLGDKWNKLFVTNGWLKEFIDAGYSWVHNMDAVGAQENNSARVMQTFYKANIARAAPVSKLEVKVDNHNLRKLSWEVRSKAITGYEIWRKAGSATTFKKVATLSRSAKKYPDRTSYASGVEITYMVKALGLPHAFASKQVKVTSPSLSSRMAAAAQPEQPMLPVTALLYPNPSSDRVTLKWNNEAGANFGTLAVYNFSGQVVISRELKVAKGNNELVLNIRSLKPGLYQVKIEGQRFSKHLMVK